MLMNLASRELTIGLPQKLAIKVFLFIAVWAYIIRYLAHTKSENVPAVRRTQTVSIHLQNVANLQPAIVKVRKYVNPLGSVRAVMRTGTKTVVALRNPHPRSYPHFSMILLNSWFWLKRFGEKKIVGKKSKIKAIRSKVCEDRSVRSQMTISTNPISCPTNLLVRLTLI